MASPVAGLADISLAAASRLVVSLSGPIEWEETAQLVWQRQGIATVRNFLEPALALALAGEMASVEGWCMLRLTDHPEWETAGFNRLDGVSAAQVWRVDGLARAIRTLAPQVLVAERFGPTLYELTRFGTDLWQSRVSKLARPSSSGPTLVQTKVVKSGAFK